MSSDTDEILDVPGAEQVPGQYYSLLSTPREHQ